MTVGWFKQAFRRLLASGSGDKCMSSRWQTHLEGALQEAGLDTMDLAPFASTQKYCDDVALLIARSYLDGRTSWLAADYAINRLFPIMLDCPTLPDCAWGIYEAFDAGEDHPDSPELSDDEVTRSLLTAQAEGWGL